MTEWAAFHRWRQQRLPLLLFMGVAMVVSAAAGSIRPVVVGAAFVWVAAFRLWDDVATRHHDSLHHPQRAVVQGPRWLFSWTCLWAMLIAATVALWMGVLAGWLGMALAAAFTYARAADGWRRWLVLLKYPWMAALLSSTWPPWPRLLLVLCCFVVDEGITGALPLPARALPFLVTFVGLWLL